MKNLLNILALTTILIFTFSCKEEIKDIKNANIHSLPKSLKEVSGITYIDSAIWIIEDSGNSNLLHKIGFDGLLLKSITVSGAKNTDWEALTSDEEGNLYIGDFGNNDNDRQDLVIYKILKEDLNKTEIELVPTITFSYDDQKEFPPSSNQLYYDCESFLYRNGYFYLFTKNRNKKFDGLSHIYKLENKIGEQKAILINKYFTNKDKKTGAITDAAISPDKSKVVLLSNLQMWIFTDFAEDNFTKGTLKNVEFETDTKREGVTFKDNNTLLITDERTKKSGGNLYEYKLN